MSDPIQPGTRIDYMGETVTVGAVGFTGGERYYWLTYDDGGTVLMIPATMVEGGADERG